MIAGAARLQRRRRTVAAAAQLSALEAGLVRMQSTPIRVRGLNGLRAVMIGCVFLAHANIACANKAGFLGVTVFQCLSGLLITGMLHRERLRIEAGAGAIVPAMLRFLGRRALRIVP